MQLTYRGVLHSKKIPQLVILLSEPKNANIIYRGNYLKEKIKPQFPWLKYFQQLFGRSASQPIFDPITLWYDHKREFLEYCWYLEDVEKLEFCWSQTFQFELIKALKSKPKTQLKYRGVSYYQ